MLWHVKHHMKLRDCWTLAFILLFIVLPNAYLSHCVRRIGKELPDPGSIAMVSPWQFINLLGQDRLVSSTCIGYTTSTVRESQCKPSTIPKLTAMAWRAWHSGVAGKA